MSDPNRLSAPTNSLETIRAAAKSRYGKFAVGAAGAFAAAGLLSACETTSATPDNTVQTTSVSTETASPTQSAEVVTAEDLLPNPETVRATIDEIKFQIPYRDNYTAAELATLSMNQTFDVREMFKGNKKLLVDDADKWFDVQFEETDGSIDFTPYANTLNEVQVAVAKDNIVSSEYIENLQPGDFNYLEKTVRSSGRSVILNELKGLGQDIDWDMSGELLENSPVINYTDNGEVLSSFEITTSYDALNNMSENTSRSQYKITYVNEDGLLKIKTISITEL